MKVGEFAKRARASRLNKKAKFDEAFKRLRQEWHLANPDAPSTSQKLSFAQRQDSTRPVLSLFPKA